MFTPCQWYSRYVIMKTTLRKISIDGEKCRGCGTCALVSGNDMVKIEGNRARIQGSGYTRRHELLIAVCPAGAIAIDVSLSGIHS